MKNKLSANRLTHLIEEFRFERASRALPNWLGGVHNKYVSDFTREASEQSSGLQPFKA